MIWNDPGLVKYAHWMARFFFFLWTSTSISQHLVLWKAEPQPYLQCWHTAKKVLVCVCACVCGESVIVCKIYQNSLVWKPCFPYFFFFRWLILQCFMSRFSFLSCFLSCSFRRRSFTSSKICISIFCQFSSWNIHTAICSES